MDIKERIDALRRMGYMTPTLQEELNKIIDSQREILSASKEAFRWIGETLIDFELQDDGTHEALWRAIRTAGDEPPAPDRKEGEALMKRFKRRK